MKSGIDYVICAAGAGTRMKFLSPEIPKPSIIFRGHTLLAWSMRSLDLYPGDRVIIISQAKDRIKEVQESSLQESNPEIPIIWIEIDQLTSGQLATAILAAPALVSERPIAIFNSDTYIRGRSILPAFEDCRFFGVIPCAQVDGHHWSFCQTNPRGEVTRTTEKERISDLASAGLYYFRHSGRFLEYATKEIESIQHGETYIAPLYNRILKDGYLVSAPIIDLFRPMGSKEQLIQYWGWEEGS